MDKSATIHASAVQTAAARVLETLFRNVTAALSIKIVLKII